MPLETLPGSLYMGIQAILAPGDREGNSGPRYMNRYFRCGRVQANGTLTQGQYSETVHMVAQITAVEDPAGVTRDKSNYTLRKYGVWPGTLRNCQAIAVTLSDSILEATDKRSRLGQVVLVSADEESTEGGIPVVVGTIISLRGAESRTFQDAASVSAGYPEDLVLTVTCPETGNKYMIDFKLPYHYSGNMGGRRANPTAELKAPAFLTDQNTPQSDRRYLADVLRATGLHEAQWYNKRYKTFRPETSNDVHIAAKAYINRVLNRMWWKGAGFFLVDGDTLAQVERDEGGPWGAAFSFGEAFSRYLVNECVSNVADWVSDPLECISDIAYIYGCIQTAGATCAADLILTGAKAGLVAAGGNPAMVESFMRVADSVSDGLSLDMETVSAVEDAYNTTCDAYNRHSGTLASEAGVPALQAPARRDARRRRTAFQDSSGFTPALRFKYTISRPSTWSYQLAPSSTRGRDFFSDVARPLGDDLRATWSSPSDVAKCVVLGHSAGMGYTINDLWGTLASNQGTPSNAGYVHDDLEVRRRVFWGKAQWIASNLYRNLTGGQLPAIETFYLDTDPRVARPGLVQDNPAMWYNALMIEIHRGILDALKLVYTRDKVNASDPGPVAIDGRTPQERRDAIARLARQRREMELMRLGLREVCNFRALLEGRLTTIAELLAAQFDEQGTVRTGMSDDEMARAVTDRQNAEVASSVVASTLPRGLARSPRQWANLMAVVVNGRKALGPYECILQRTALWYAANPEEFRREIARLNQTDSQGRRTGVVDPQALQLLRSAAMQELARRQREQRDRIRAGGDAAIARTQGQFGNRQPPPPPPRRR